MDDSYQLLAVDDEPDTLRTNCGYLEARGYRVDTAVCAVDVLELLKNQKYDAILLDVLLPDMNGFALCETVRALTPAPTLSLSCVDGREDKIKGLTAGGEDYTTKPYNSKELVARVYAQVHRGSMKRLVIDHQNRLLQIDNQIIPLSQKEFELFLSLMDHSGQTPSVAELYQEVWRTGEPDSANTVAVHITRLRHKLGGAGSVIGRIETVWGEGYRFILELEARTIIWNDFWLSFL